MNSVNSKVPFDSSKFSRLMEEQGLDIAILSSRHNIRYASGGYYYHFHANSQRMAESQYISFVGIPAKNLDDTFYIMRSEERMQMEYDHRPWFPELHEALRGTAPATERLVQLLLKKGYGKASIGVEMPFLPADVWVLLRKGLSYAEFHDITGLMSELRAVKSKDELDIMRSAYDKTAQAIRAAFDACEEGISTRNIERVVAREISMRDLSFLFALVSAGPKCIRAPSEKLVWERGMVCHIDAGAHERDYIADICRMASMGPPSTLARELHAACIEVQDRVRNKIRAGVSCGEVIAAGEEASRHGEYARYARFVVHSIGMVPYEHPVMARESTRPLESGMVLSIETDFIHPDVGHVKIEDAVIVNEQSCEGIGDFGRELLIR